MKCPPHLHKLVSLRLLDYYNGSYTFLFSRDRDIVGIHSMKSSHFQRYLAHEALENRLLLDASGFGAGEPVEDFSLLDVNATSPTYNQKVSPRDFDGVTTAWYLTRSW